MPEQTPAYAPHPAIFLVLYLPWGISLGYFSVTLGYLNAQAGVSTVAIAGVVSLFVGMGVWQILWSPLVDTVLSYRLWYLLAAVSLGFGLAATGIVRPSPAAMGWLRLLAVLVGAAATLTSVTAAGLMARGTPVANQGRAGGWSQVGGLGGTGLGGGGGVWIATHVAVPWLSAVVLGAACAATVGALLFLPEPDHSHRHAGALVSLRNVARETWGMVRSRRGALAMFLMILPLGSAGASGLWSAVAGDWHASADLVSLVSGVGGGVASAVGCFAGGYLCDVIDRKAGYVLPGVLMALCALAMAAAAKTPLSFTLFTLLYAGINGMVFGACYAVVLEASGVVAAAAKCNLLISLCNIPIAGMTAFDGWLQTGWGSNAMLIGEAILGLLAATVFAAISFGSRQRVLIATADLN